MRKPSIRSGGSAPRRASRGPAAPAWRLRAGVQLISLATVLWIGYAFAAWVAGLERGVIAGARPPGVEGFLPISALISLRHLLETGEFSGIHPAGTVIFALAVLTSLLLKKSFCSWICPIGTLSEMMSRAAARLGWRGATPPRWLDRTLMGVKYLLLAFFIHAIFIQMTPRAVAMFLNSPYNKVADVKMLHFFQHISTTAAVVIAALAALSILIPYFWCRYLCPYGALLGLASLLSPLKVVRAAGSCTGCGRCASVCPARLPVDRLATVSSVECTGCLECVDKCPEPGALGVGTAPWPRRILRPAVFAALVVMLFYGGIGLAKIGGRWRTDVTDREFLRRVGEIDGPLYHHARGSVPDYSADD